MAARHEQHSRAARHPGDVRVSRTPGERNRQTGYFGALPREAQLSEPTSRLNEGIFAHADFDDVDS